MIGGLDEEALGEIIDSQSIATNDTKKNRTLNAVKSGVRRVEQGGLRLGDVNQIRRSALFIVAEEIRVQKKMKKCL